MGFYIRKSLKVGPLRFNLSKSGIGVSAGIPGFRVGSGPRGNYVHMGLGGLYYRSTIPSSSSSPSITPSKESSIYEQPIVSSHTHAPLEEIDSAHVSQLVDSSSQELLNELKEKKKMMQYWPFVLALSLLTIWLGSDLGWPGYVELLIFILGCGGAYIVYLKDVLRKTVVLFYDFDSTMEAAYDQLHSSAGKLADSTAKWHIAASGKVLDKKYHAGASDLVDRKDTFIKKAAPPFLKTNIETISMGVGRQILHFFPDRILVYDENGVGAVGYRELDVKVGSRRFIEDGNPPADAKVVDKTWRYINKNGGPDRRFKDNRELPICLYDEMMLSSATGLNEIVQISQHGICEDFANAIRELALIIPPGSK